MPDFGGRNDGQCEMSMGHLLGIFGRCTEPSVRSLTFGQQGAWTYRYCEPHALRTEAHIKAMTEKGLY